MPFQPTLSLRLEHLQASFNEPQTDRRHYQAGAAEAVELIVWQCLSGEPHSVVATKDRQQDGLGVVDGLHELQGAERGLPRFPC